MVDREIGNTHLLVSISFGSNIEEKANADRRDDIELVADPGLEVVCQFLVANGE